MLLERSSSLLALTEALAVVRAGPRGSLILVGGEAGVGKTSLVRAFGELQRLGARPAARIVSRRLRERGARRLPRGPRPATRGNPANLTGRELGVAALLAEGLTNAQIADRLFLSRKTAGHHVSSILRKLDVQTRGQAAAEAVRLGIASQDR